MDWKISARWLEKYKRRTLLSCSFWEDKTKGGSANQLLEIGFTVSVICLLFDIP
ncbi:hypothetical protein COLO4_20576 [Corchorus olitorius]|uniref:Uncharacterized protein n=1 Tax=Corchorus olitorius TaxID=93759 RepID=A0A1R3IYY4_9ROSI|nr:hypothetical protein COLO4_20576 [Corchorus olitorius]